MTSPEENRGILGDAVAAIGFFAVVTVALWGASNMLRLAPAMFSTILPSSARTSTTTNIAATTTLKKVALSPAELVAAQRKQSVTTRQIDFSRYAAVTTLIQKKVATPTQKAKAKAVAPAGRPDLSVSILAVGMIDPTTGTLVERMPIDRQDIGAVRFIVRNVGTAASGSWRFSASLPVSTDEDSYTSTAQASIGPGGHITYTLKFDNIVPGDVFSVRIDPAGKLNEARTANNTASVTF